MRKTLAATAATLLLALTANAQQPAGDVHLSPALQKLLQEEMREVARGTQNLALALATADWKTVVHTSEKIRASYILDRKLTPAQRHELERALPEGFKQMDGEFHARAQKLGHAAAARDHELAAFHFSRMVESCASCHASHAKTRFPGFATEKPAAHRH
jgi:cytochrome c556